LIGHAAASPILPVTIKMTPLGVYKSFFNC